MSSRKDINQNVEGELSNESDVQTEESNSRRLIFTNKGLNWRMVLRISPDGRYLFYIKNSSSVEVIDTLFKKKKILNLDFSAAIINGMPLASNFAVKDYYAFGLESALVLLDDPFYGYHVGTGVLNLEQSTVAIGQSTAISFQGLRLMQSRFFPKSYPANLKDGFILKLVVQGRSEYFDVKLDEQNQLQATKIDWLSNVNVMAVNEEFAYSLGWKPTYDGTLFKGGYFELRKRSLETGELSSYPTMNSEAMRNLVIKSVCRVGNQFFGYINDYARPYKSQIVSLNLDTLEWTKTKIEIHGCVHQIATDGEHTMVICVLQNDGYGYYYRFVVNKPIRLSTCVWYELQSIVHSRPDVYNFICSKLPSNIRPLGPIEHSVPLDTEL